MFKKANLMYASTTPNIERSECIRPAQHYVPAAYLPNVRFDNKVGDWKVISYGKVVAQDVNGKLVPAGLAIDVVTAIANAYADKDAFIAAKANFGNVYTQNDVDDGKKNFAGDAVTVNEPVVASFFASYNAASTLNNPIGKPTGIAPYDVWKGSGAGQDGNPIDYTYTNYNLQTGASILTRYFIELPVVANTSGLILPGMTVFEGTPSYGLVTFNKNSNFCPLSAMSISAISDPANITASAFAAGTGGAPTDAELKAEFDRVSGAVDTLLASMATNVNAKIDLVESYVNNTLGSVLGKVLFIDSTFPKDFLEYVKTYLPNVTSLTALDKAPGTATAGLPDNITYAGITTATNAKVVRINVII